MMTLLEKKLLKQGSLNISLHKLHWHPALSKHFSPSKERSVRFRALLLRRSYINAGRQIFQFCKQREFPNDVTQSIRRSSNYLVPLNFMIQAIIIIIVHEVIVQQRTNKIFQPILAYVGLSGESSLLQS